MAKKSGHRGIGHIYGFRAVDSLASRVMGTNKKKALPDPKKLHERAERITNPRKKQALLLEATRAEKNFRTTARRMTRAKAEARARRAMEAAKWHRESPKS